MTMKGIRLSFGLVLAVALAAPAFAWTVSSSLNDSEEPGSVIVFHKFITGYFFDELSGDFVPRTQIEISITCPKGSSCAQYQEVRLRAHWVCPPGRDEGLSARCAETNFDLFGSVNGTILFNPDNIYPYNNYVPPPPCD